MTTKVKICGLKTEAALEAALAGGADYVGLVFFPPSPRNVTPEARQAACRQGPRPRQIVALMVDPDDALIDSVVAAVAPDLIQLHGDETPERAADIRRRWGMPVMKAIKVETAADAGAALGYRDAADLILFDARAPVDSTRPGGNGAAFDWRALTGVKEQVRYMLSGGLTPDNVAEAIRITGAGNRRRLLRRRKPPGREGPRAHPPLPRRGKGGLAIVACACARCLATATLAAALGLGGASQATSGAPRARPWPRTGAGR